MFGLKLFGKKVSTIEMSPVGSALALGAQNQILQTSHSIYHQLKAAPTKKEKLSKAEFYEWKHRNILKRKEFRPAQGTLESTFFVPLKSYTTKFLGIQNEAFEIISRSKGFGLQLSENPQLKAAQIAAKKLENAMKTLCSHKEKSSGKKGHVREKRFFTFLIFFVLTTITAYGISTAVNSSNRLITKEDIEIANETAAEKHELRKIEIARLEKDSKRIDDLEKRFDRMEHMQAVTNYGRKLKQVAEMAYTQLRLLLRPDSYEFEPSIFMEKMAQDILQHFSDRGNDLFDHVIGTGVAEVLYLSTFKNFIVQDKDSNSCEDSHVMIKATTMIPYEDIVGTETDVPQRYATEDGRFFYINKDFIADGSNFRPDHSLSSQRLIMSSSNISVTVLNNTVFMIDNKGLHLDIVISCPGKPNTQETIYNSPFVRLHTSCEITSTHLNISSFIREVIQDDLSEELGLYDITDEILDFNAGYHRSPIDDKHDISEMFEKADDIFVKETEILQNEMKRIENTTSITKLFEKIGSTVSDWFTNSLHKIVGGVCVVLGIICGLFFLWILFKCCSFYQKKKN